MATEPHGTTKQDGPHGQGAVEMPEPTVAPLVLSLGLAMFAAGVITGPAFFLVGGAVLLYGLGLWISALLPGKGHMHEELAPPENWQQYADIAAFFTGKDWDNDGAPNYGLDELPMRRNHAWNGFLARAAGYAR